MRFLVACVVCMSAAVAAADELVVITKNGCHPCSVLKKDLLRHPEIYAPHSISLLEGMQAMEDWGVTAVPTIVRLKHGREVARRVGYSKPSDLTDWLKKHD